MDACVFGVFRRNSDIFHCECDVGFTGSRCESGILATTSFNTIVLKVVWMKLHASSEENPALRLTVPVDKLWFAFDLFVFYCSYFMIEWLLLDNLVALIKSSWFWVAFEVERLRSRMALRWMNEERDVCMQCCWVYLGSVLESWLRRAVLKAFYHTEVVGYIQFPVHLSSVSQIWRRASNFKDATVCYERQQFYSCKFSANTCASNPCYTGTCEVGMSGYICHCDPNYEDADGFPCRMRKTDATFCENVSWL